jgi:hypothetical protein
MSLSPCAPCRFPSYAPTCGSIERVVVHDMFTSLLRCNHFNMASAVATMFRNNHRYVCSPEHAFMLSLPGRISSGVWRSIRERNVMFKSEAHDCHRHAPINVHVPSLRSVPRRERANFLTPTTPARAIIASYSQIIAIPPAIPTCASHLHVTGSTPQLHASHQAASSAVACADRRLTR